MRLACALALTSIAACHSSGGTTTPVAAAPVAGAPLRLADDVAGAFTADDRAAYWFDGGAVWRRGFGDAAPARLGDAPGEVVGVVRHGDRVYALAADAIRSFPIAGGAAAARELELGELAAWAPAADGLVIARGAEVALVPWDGGAPRTIASGFELVTAVGADDGAYYVAALSEAVHAPRGDNLPPEAIWRIARDGGARTLVADGQYMVRGLDARGGRITWSTEDGIGVQSIEIDADSTPGSPRSPVAHRERVPRVLLAGAVEAFAAGRDGPIARVSSGMIADAGVRPPRLFALPEGAHAVAFDPIAAAGDGIVVRLADPGERPSLWWLPRPGPGAPAVIAWPRLRATRLAVDGDDLYFVDSPAEPRDGWPARVVRVPARGPARTLATAPTIDAMAVGGGTVVYAAGGALHRVDRDGRDLRLCDARQVIGLALGPRAVYWIEGGVVRTVSIDGGVPTTFHHPDFGDSGTGAPFAEMVVDGTSLYYSSLGWGAAGVFHTRGGAAAETLFSNDDDAGLGDSLTSIAGDLYVVVGSSRIAQVPMNGAAPGEIFAGDSRLVLDRLVAGGDRLYATDLGGDHFAIVSIDPSRGTWRTVARFPSDEQSHTIAAGDHAVYVAPAFTRWIIRYRDVDQGDGAGASGRSAAHEPSAQRPANTPPTSSPGRDSR